MPCKKPFSTTICGAGWRNSVYDLKGTAVAEKVVTESSDATTKYTGCFLDAPKRRLERALGIFTDPQDCFKRAKDAGLKYVGLQYGKHCFGGNKLNINEKKPESDCRMPCQKPFQSTKCGGGWRNSVYELIEEGTYLNN